jgi:hypothetical protein
MDDEGVKSCWDLVGKLVWNGEEHLSALKDSALLQQLFEDVNDPLFHK